jgi:hypothetical protein
MLDSSQTVWEESTQVLAGMRLMVRGAQFMVERSSRGAVTVTAAVPDGFWAARSDGGMTATALMNPNEARSLAGWLIAAAAAADETGPPLYV